MACEVGPYLRVGNRHPDVGNMFSDRLGLVGKVWLQTQIKGSGTLGKFTWTLGKGTWTLGKDTRTPLEFFFQEQSYSSLHSGQSLACNHVRDDPCGAIADFCGVIADPCGIVTIHEVIGGRRCNSLNIKHC